MTALEQQIYDAFIDAPFPADGYDIYAAQTDDDYGSPTFTTAHLPGRYWHEVTPEQLRDCYAAFSYLRPDGWRHYLPALLWLELRQPHNSFDIIWILREEQGEFRQRQEERHRALNKTQVTAVVAFLAYYLNRERNIHAAHAHHRWAQAGMEWSETKEPADLEQVVTTLNYWRQRLASVAFADEA